MSETPPFTQDAGEQNIGELGRARAIAYLVYGCFIFGALLPILPIIGVIVAYIKRPEMSGTIFESHMTWLIRTFFGCFILTTAAALLAIVSAGWLGADGTAGSLIGFFGLAALLAVTALVWGLYRLVKGALAVVETRAIDAPQAIF